MQMRHLDIESLSGDKYPHSSFHDSTINNIRIDLLTREVMLECVIDVGEANDDGAEPEQSRGVLTLTGLLYIALEPPNSNYLYEENGLNISYDGSVETTSFKAPIHPLPARLPTEAFAHGVFSANWNIYL